MNRKVDSVYGLPIFIAVWLAVFNMLSNLNALDLTLTIMPAFVAAGAGFGFISARRQLKSIEAKGEYKASFKAAFYSAVVAVVEGFVLWYLGTVNAVYVKVALAEFWTSLGSFQVAYPLTLLICEKRHEKVLMYDGFLGNRTYPIPRTQESNMIPHGNDNVSNAI